MCVPETFISSHCARTKGGQEDTRDAEEEKTAIMADGNGIPLSELFAEPVVTDSHEDAVVRLHDSLRAGDVPRVEEAIAVLRQRAIPLTVCAQDGRSAALVTAAFPTTHSGEIMHILIREGVFQDRMGHAVETLFCAARHDNPAVIEPLLSLGIPVEALERRPAANVRQ